MTAPQATLPFRLPPLLFQLLYTTTFLLLLLPWVPTTVDAQGCNDRGCMDTIYNLEEELDDVRRANDGLNRDKKHLMQDLLTLTMGLTEERMARDSAKRTLEELNMDVQFLRDQLEATQSGNDKEEAVCHKDSPDCPGGQ